MVITRPNRSAKVTVHPFPAPFGGWNTRDSMDSMKETDAVVLDNLFPGFGQITTRAGASSFATGLGAAVFTLAEFNAGTFRKMIAGANGKIWDVSAAGAGTQLATGFTNDKWQWAQFDAASGGARLGLVNGQDAPQIYDGSAISAMTVSGSGLTATNLIGINIYKNRSYFWEANSQNFWYSAVNALGGTLTKFPLGRVQGTGGNLTFMATWTRDSGNGMDDLAVFALSSGDVLIYQGDNPGDANAWALVGRFSIGAPLSIRGYENVGGDLWIITRSGYIPLSKVLESGRANEGDFALSSKIRGSVLEMVTRYASNYGWQMILYPKHSLGSCVIVNVPLASSVAHQHVINVGTGSWCRFTGLNANCWGIYNDALYFGGSGVVYKFDDGTSDAGAPIRCEVQPAWNYLKDRSFEKQLTSARLMGSASGEVAYTLRSGSDFGVLSVEAQGATQAQGTGGDWDTSDWDVTDWPAESLTFANWHSVGGIGRNFALNVRFESARYGMSLYAFSLGYQRGGPF